MRARKSPSPLPEDESAISSERSATSSEPEGPNPLGLEPAPPFVPDDERPPVAHASDLELDDEYVPPPPELLDWTPERLTPILRSSAALVHYADPLGREPGGDDLWRLTETDAAEIGEPLARILNRYSVTRTAAGLSDEVAVGIGLLGYGRRNLVLRGQLAEAKRAREPDLPEGLFDGALPADHVSTADEPLMGMEGRPVFPPPPAGDA